MITVTFCIYLKTDYLSVFFDRIIKSLNFTPNKMDVYYNEFSSPKLFIQYNTQLPHLLSIAEVDGGITSFCLYDSKYSNKNITPFFRAKILDTTFSNEQVECILEWVSYPSLYFDPDIHFLNKYLCDKVNLIFLYAYDQIDGITKEKTYCLKKLLNLRSSKWGKRVMVGNMPFIAAPVMYYGKEYFRIIPKDILLKVQNSSVITINGQEIVAVKLFDLYENPNLHRASQKNYWRVTALSQRIKKYQEKEFSVDAIKRYKIRYKKMKAQSN